MAIHLAWGVMPGRRVNLPGLLGDVPLLIVTPCTLSLGSLRDRHGKMSRNGKPAVLRFRGESGREHVHAGREGWRKGIHAVSTLPPTKHQINQIHCGGPAWDPRQFWLPKTFPPVFARFGNKTAVRGAHLPCDCTHAAPVSMRRFAPAGAALWKRFENPTLPALFDATRLAGIRRRQKHHQRQPLTVSPSITSYKLYVHQYFLPGTNLFTTLCKTSVTVSFRLLYSEKLSLCVSFKLKITAATLQVSRILKYEEYRRVLLLHERNSRQK